MFVLRKTRLFALGAGLAGGSLVSYFTGTTPIPKAEQEAPKSALDPEKWISFPVTEKERLTHDTQRLRFGLPDKDQVVGLPVASALITKAPLGDDKGDGTKKPVIRPYTPVSDRNSRGYFDLVVKGYPNGTMSKHINELQVGDQLECKGPIPKMDYKPNMKKQIGMVCGGSGMTPMLQVVREIVNNPNDKTQVKLVYANKSEQDIICRDILDGFAKEHSNFSVYYVVDEASSKDWPGGLGHIDKDMLKQQMPPPTKDSLVLVCGPPPMYKAISGEKASKTDQGAVTGALGELGYKPEHVYKF